MGEHPLTFTQRVDVVLIQQLADERRDIHPEGGHRPSSSDCAVAEDGGVLFVTGISTREVHPESPPLLVTLTSG
jgi:hypothetical protein